MEILIQLIGVLGIVASIVSFQCKKRKNILLFRTLNEMLFAVQYIFLGAYTGAAMNIVGCLRNVIFQKQNGRDRKSRLSVALFCMAFILFGILAWDGGKSLLIIAAKVLSTVAYGNSNTTVTRVLILFTSSGWLIYNVLVFSVAGALCEAITLCSVIVGIVRFDIIPRIKGAK